jgi:hypothetical protein
MNKFAQSVTQNVQRIFTFAIFAMPLLALNIPTAALARPIVIQDGVTFDFQGCARTSDGNDLICRGSFLSRKGEQPTRIYRQNGDGTGDSYNTFITNFKGKKYIASEISIGENGTCQNDCSYKDITFVEGVNYSASFVFRDVSLPSSKIALFNIYVSATGNQKIRNINANSSGNSSPRSSDSEVDNIPTASTTETPSRTEIVASNCPDRSQQFVAGETDSFNIYICGQNRPTQYIGVAKDTGASIRLNLTSSSRGRYVARNGSTAYTITRNSLKITQNGRVLQTQPLRVSQWRN